MIYFICIFSMSYRYGKNRLEREQIMAKYELLKQEGEAKRGTFHTVHGDIQTPVFMNVGTVAAIKGAVSTQDLKDIKCQVELSIPTTFMYAQEIN